MYNQKRIHLMRNDPSRTSTLEFILRTELSKPPRMLETE